MLPDCHSNFSKRGKSNSPGGLHLILCNVQRRPAFIALLDNLKKVAVLGLA